MNDITDRAHELDAFARESEERPGGTMMIPAQAYGMGGQLIIGAQQVAVRRDLKRVMADIRFLAAAAAGEWYYNFPVRNKRTGQTEYIQGGTIKMANDLLRSYGNCGVRCGIPLDVGDSWVFTARIVDYETGADMERPFQQRKAAGKIGGDDDARKLDIAFQIGASKAIRNVVLNFLQTFAGFAFEEAKKAITDKIAGNLPAWRARVVEGLRNEGVALARVNAIVGRPEGEWLVPDVARIIQMMKAVSEGMTSWAEVFPPIEAEAEPPETMQDFAPAPASEPPPRDGNARSERSEKVGKEKPAKLSKLENRKQKAAREAAEREAGQEAATAPEMPVQADEAPAAMDAPPEVPPAPSAPPEAPAPVVQADTPWSADNTKAVRLGLGKAESEAALLAEWENYVAPFAKTIPEADYSELDAIFSARTEAYRVIAEKGKDAPDHLPNVFTLRKDMRNASTSGDLNAVWFGHVQWRNPDGPAPKLLRFDGEDWRALDRVATQRREELRHAGT